MATRRPGRQTPRTLRVLCMAALLCATPGAGAWGPLGHELAGEIAESYVDPTARAAITALIGRESLAAASTWADRMRSDPSPFWQRESGPYHYVDIPPGKRYGDVAPAREGDALSALADFREDLLNPRLPLAERQLALRFAMHIVQDLHQPLHVGNGRDRGGNQVSLRVAGKRSNLHRLWDSQLLYSAGRSERQWLQYFESAKLLRAPVTEDADPMRWVEESAAIRDTLYPPPKEVGERYLRGQLPRAEIRVALAGIRTAAWLNATLGAASAPPGDSTTAPDPRPWWRRWLDG